MSSEKTDKIVKNKTNWPELIYYKRSTGDIRKTGGRKTIVNLKSDLNAREVELALAHNHDQIYRYNNDLTIEAYLRGKFWTQMVAFERVDAP